MASTNGLPKEQLNNDIVGSRPRPLTDADPTTRENRLFRLALEQVGVYVFEYRIDRDELRLLAPAPTEAQNWHGGPDLIAENIHASEEDALYLADAFANAAFGRSASLDIQAHTSAEETWLRVTLSPVLRDARMTGTLIGTIWNITAQKLAEQQENRNKAFRNNVLEGISSGWELDLEGGSWIYLWNGEPALALLQPQQMHLDNYDLFFSEIFLPLVHPGDLDACADVQERGALLARFRRGEHTCTGEYRIRRLPSADAPYEWRRITVRLSRDTRTLHPKASCHITDISPQKAKELEAERDKLVMEQAARDERRANARKSQFLADTARTLHAPMRAMVGVSELALMEQMSDTARDYLQQIHDFGDDLLRTLSNVLALADTGSHQGIPTEEEYAPMGLLNSVAEIVRGTENSALRIRLEGVVPSRLYGDSMRLRQALINLAGAAMRASAEVELYLTGTPQDAETILLSAVLIDRTTQLSENQLLNLFVAFASSYGGGTGLALSQARQLARLMGGNLSAEAFPERGVRITLTVPQRVIDARPSEST